MMTFATFKQQHNSAMLSAVTSERECLNPLVGLAFLCGVYKSL